MEMFEILHMRLHYSVNLHYSDTRTARTVCWDSEGNVVRHLAAGFCI
jgi:hypothetical protein